MRLKYKLLSEQEKEYYDTRQICSAKQADRDLWNRIYPFCADQVLGCFFHSNLIGVIGFDIHQINDRYKVSNVTIWVKKGYRNRGISKKINRQMVRRLNKEIPRQKYFFSSQIISNKGLKSYEYRLTIAPKFAKLHSTQY